MSRSKLLLVALLCALISASAAVAGDISLSLNLDFNTPNDLSSGGTWTVVAKSDERGIDSIVFSMEEGTLNFNPATGFFHSDIFDIQNSAVFGGVRFEIVEGQTGTPVLDVGVVGGTWPSTYVDDPDLVILSSYPDLGSFSGGVELATGTFDPGVVPQWYADPNDGFGGLQYIDESGTSEFADNILLTVRGNIPEPSTLVLLGLGLTGAVISRRCRR